MPKVFKYEVGDKVRVDNYFGNKEHSLAGKTGKIIGLRENGNYDYNVKFDDKSPPSTFRESELTKLNEYIPKIGDLVKLKTTGEEGIIVAIDDVHKQAEMRFNSNPNLYQVYGWNKYEPVEVNTRKSWDQYFMDIAETVATRATCDRLHVGCVIVKDKKIVSTGYNGSISKQDQCNEVGHLYNEQGRCVRTIHAEQNALLFADREELKGATAYVTHEPCENCAKLLVQAGIKRVVFKNTYENKFSKYFLDMVESEYLKEGV